MIDDSRLIATIEVYHELEKKDDEVFAWAKDRKETLFLEIDEDVQSHVIRLMQNYPRLVDTKKGKSGGDPFVIAQALAGNPALTVISQEKGGSLARPNIPVVCAAEGVRVIELLDLIEEEDWTF
ncbi:hypothetical protein ASE06_11580 [Sphingopyxis sp. Root214]|nr:hypothetical protein ASD73_09230 [Sphingopyxis sp. Root154]KRC07216.1 hypothetical protein ASE06_11580 [Sphingopyxis sp. Root214]